MTQPFTLIADVFDQLMFDVDYEEWVDYIEALLTFSDHPVTEILDVACGTATPTWILHRRGYRVWGIDRSLPMLRVARRKTGGKVPLLAADMRMFHLRKQFDAVLCIFDSLNNLLSEQDLEMAFRRAREHLKDGGVFIFDMNSIAALKDYWDTDVKVKETPHLVSIWRTTYNSQNHTSRLEITVFVKRKNGWIRLDEVHVERGYPIRTVLQLLRRAGFQKAEAFHHLTLRPATENSLRFTVVAR